MLPALVYWASRSEAFEWIWSFPGHQGSALFVALGLAGAFALVLLGGAGVAHRWEHGAAPSRAARVWKVAGAALLVAGAGALLVRWPCHGGPGGSILQAEPPALPAWPIARGPCHEGP